MSSEETPEGWVLGARAAEPSVVGYVPLTCVQTPRSLLAAPPQHPQASLGSDREDPNADDERHQYDSGGGVGGGGGGGGGVSGAAPASPVRHPPPPPTERALIKAASRGFAPDDLDLVPRSPVRPPQVVAEQARWLGLGLGLVSNHPNP